MPDHRKEFGTRIKDETGMPLDDAATKKNGGEAVGYAHHAHQPDPSARYSFEAEKQATLPHDAKRRWKVTG